MEYALRDAKARFSALEHDRRQLGLEEEREGWPAEFDDPAFSRRVLGLDDA